MTKNENKIVKEKIRQIILDINPEIESADIKDESNFYFDLGLDSIEVSSLIMKTENVFDVKIPLKEEYSLKTFGDLVKITCAYQPKIDENIIKKAVTKTKFPFFRNKHKTK